MNHWWQRLRLPDICLVLVFLFSGRQSAAAQETSASIGPELRAAIVRQLGDDLRREYVLDEIGARMASRITTQLTSGA